MRRTIITSIVILILTLNQTVNSDSILDWFWKNSDNKKVESNGVPLVNIPYESMTDDEKFLHQAALFTEIKTSSPLELCQHKIIMKIKQSCSSLAEEELAKLSVNLLNCQSQVENRRTYPCTEGMSIKECTKDMDADTWNTYHLISNRARAVCYSARSVQFRALAELTVNKLIQTAQNQIHALDSLKESQEQLQEKTSDVLQLLHNGNNQLLKQQQHLKDAQLTAQSLASENYRNLINEKAIIRTGHTKLVTVIDDVKTRLDDVKEQLHEHTDVHQKRHEEIMKNLTNIQQQANELLNRIEQSAQEYEKTLKMLEQINISIEFLWNSIEKIKLEINKNLGWITQYTGTSELELNTIYWTFLHAIYLLIAMISAAFLQAPLLTRISIITTVPLNLITFWKYGLNSCLDFISLTALLSLITAHKLNTHYQSTVERMRTIGPPREVFFRSCSYVPSRKAPDSIVESHSDLDINLSDDISNPIYYDDKENFDADTTNQYVRQRTHKQESYYDDNFDKYSSMSVSSSKKRCVGFTKSGSSCKASAIKGFICCSKHLSQDPFIEDRDSTYIFQ